MVAKPKALITHVLLVVEIYNVRPRQDNPGLEIVRCIQI